MTVRNAGSVDKTPDPRHPDRRYRNKGLADKLGIGLVIADAIALAAVTILLGIRYPAEVLAVSTAVLAAATVALVVLQRIRRQ